MSERAEIDQYFRKLKRESKRARLARRDQCFVVGNRAVRLNDIEAAAAWRELATRLGEMGDRDMPKFADLLGAIRAATIHAKRK